MIKEFEAYLCSMGYGKGSVSGMPRCVALFLDYHKLSDPKAASPAHVTSFYEWLHIRPNERRGGGLSESHIHYHLYALRVFFSWLEHTGRIRENPTSALSFKKGEKKTRQPLSQTEVKALFEAARTDRERALLHLLYSCGLRRTEAVMLDEGDLHFKSRMLYVRRGKGCKRRALPLTPKVSDALEAYLLTERGSLAASHLRGDRRGAAFMLNKVGGRMSGNSCNALVKELKERAGIETEVTPHYLRHSIATHLLEAGVPIEQVRDFLGHSSLEATQLYAKVCDGQLKKL